MPEHIDQSAQTEHAEGEQLLVLDADLCVKAASKSFYSVFHTTPEQYLGKKLADLDNGQWNVPALLTLLHQLPEIDGKFDDLAMEHDFAASGHGTVLVTGRRLPPLNGLAKWHHPALHSQHPPEQRILWEARTGIGIFRTPLPSSV